MPAGGGDLARRALRAERCAPPDGGAPAAGGGGGRALPPADARALPADKDGKLASAGRMFSALTSRAFSGVRRRFRGVADAGAAGGAGLAGAGRAHSVPRRHAPNAWARARCDSAARARAAKTLQKLRAILVSSTCGGAAATGFWTGATASASSTPAISLTGSRRPQGQPLSWGLGVSSVALGRRARRTVQRGLWFCPCEFVLKNKPMNSRQC